MTKLNNRLQGAQDRQRHLADQPSPRLPRNRHREERQDRALPSPLMEVRYDLPDFRRRMLAAERRPGN
jgi:hypothetical protein